MMWHRVLEPRKQSILPSAMRTTLSLLAVFAAGANANEYTMETFEAARAGKSAFVKFLAPW